MEIRIASIHFEGNLPEYFSNKYPFSKLASAKGGKRALCCQYDEHKEKINGYLLKQINIVLLPKIPSLKLFVWLV